MARTRPASPPSIAAPGSALRSPQRRASLLLMVCGATAGLALPLGARAAESHPTWAQLTPTQQRILEPLRADWPTFEADRKRKWLDIAARYPAMSAQQRQTLQDRMRSWAALPPEERRLARENFLATAHKPLQSRREAWERYKQLPEAERRKLGEEAHKARPQHPNAVGSYTRHPTNGVQPRPPLAKEAAHPVTAAPPPAAPAAPAPCATPAQCAQH